MTSARKNPAIRWWPKWHPSTIAEHRRRLDRQESAARSIVCPHCGASIGEACAEGARKHGNANGFRAAHIARVKFASVVPPKPVIDDEAPPIAPAVVDRGTTRIVIDDEDELRALRADTGCPR